MKPCKKPICARVLAALPLLAAPAWADDLIVVHTEDATLVCPKAKAQDIKALLARVSALPDGARWL